MSLGHFLACLALVPALARAQINPQAMLPAWSQSHSSFEAKVPCPADGKAATLTAWRERQIARLTGGYEAGPKAVLADLKTCFKDQPPACMKGLESYARERTPASLVKRLLGTEGSAEADAFNILKSEKDLPVELLAKDAKGQPIPGRVKIPENIIELAKQKGWRTATYKTRSTGGFDRAPNLFILAIPGKERDLILQMQLPAGGNDYDPVVTTLPAGHAVTGQYTLTTIAVDKTVTPPIGQLQIHRKALLEGSGAYKWNPTVQDGGHCLGCHTAPMRPISPVGYVNQNGQEKPMGPLQSAEIDAINEILGQDRVSWGSYVAGGKEIHRGPARDLQPLGFAPKDSPTRTEAYLRKCASGVEASVYKGAGSAIGGGNYRVDLPSAQPEEIRWGRVASAMNCTTCHARGKVRGPITDHFSREEIRFKVLVDRSMPDDEELNMSERLALVACLEAERNDPAVRQDWQTGGRWMKSVSCTDAILPEAGETVPH